MAPRLTRSTAKQRAVTRVRSSVEIDMAPGAYDGAGNARGAGGDGEGSDDDDQRTSLHWSGDEDGGSSSEEAASSGVGKRRGGGGGAAAGRRKRGGAGGEGDAITPYEWGNMTLLVLLYAMQGIPLGLTMGTM
jgi:hypothetical protein